MKVLDIPFRYFVILPAALPKWDIGQFIQESDGLPGKYTSDEFFYNSGSNNNFLSIEEIKKLIKTDLNA